MSPPWSIQVYRIPPWATAVGMAIEVLVLAQPHSPCLLFPQLYAWPLTRMPPVELPAVTSTPLLLPPVSAVASLLSTGMVLLLRLPSPSTSSPPPPQT